MNLRLLRASPSIFGSCEMPWHWRQRCSEERVRCGSLPAGHRGSRPAEVARAGGRRRSPLPPRPTARSISRPWGRWVDRRWRSASSTWRRSSGRSRSAGPASLGLYRSTHCLSRCGAPVEYLAHSASFQLTVNNAPSKPGIKQLIRCRRVQGQNNGLRPALT